MKVREAIEILGKVNKFDNLALLFYKWGLWPLKVEMEYKEKQKRVKKVFVAKRPWNPDDIARIGSVIKKPDEKSEEVKINNRDYLRTILDSWQIKDESKDLSETFRKFASGFKDFTLSIGYRLVIGMGYSSPVENGFLFHHTYGIPYIPGEALKGLTRSALLLAMYSHLVRSINTSSEDEREDLIRTLDRCLTSGIRDDKGNFKTCPYEKKTNDIFQLLKDKCLKWKEEEKAPHVENCADGDISILELYERIFGTQKKRGEVIFFDAFPIDLKTDSFELDIMNPHYGDYYRYEGKKPPADWYNPNPIVFLALANTRFKFHIAYYPLNPADESISEKILDNAEKLLRFALTTYGIGGKTRSGYGWFK